MKAVRRRHTGSGKSKTKILFRILFVVVAAAVITALSILLGTHLKQKADSAAPLFTGTDDLGGGGREEKTLPEGVPVVPGDPDLSVCAADLDISSVNEEELMKRILSLPDFYNAVSVSVTRAGKLTYVSPAVAELTRQTVPDPTVRDDEVNASLVTVSDILTVAGQRGLRTCLIYETAPEAIGSDAAASFAKTIDLAVVGELSALAPDAILIDGLLAPDGTLDFDALSGIIGYLADLRSVSGDTAIGVVLPASVFLDTPTAAQIQTLIEYVNVLGIGVNVAEPTTEDGAYYSVETDCYPLRGGFTTYNLRAVIKAAGEDASRGAYRALSDMGVKNVQFTAFVADVSKQIEDAPSSSASGDEPPIDERTNENAVTNENRLTEQESDSADTEEATSAAATEWGAAAAPGG